MNPTKTNNMYIVISSSPDGDTYSIHQDLEAAKKAFNKEKESIEDSGFYDDAVYFASVTEGSKFGWGTHGDFFGGEIIEEFSL